jgi:hypothetical protein
MFVRLGIRQDARAPFKSFANAGDLKAAENVPKNP